MSEKQPIVMRRQRLSLVPVTEQDAELLAAVPFGRDVSVTVGRVTRSLRHHRWFMALLAKVVENSTFYRSTDHLLLYLKQALGLYEDVTMHDGVVVVRFKSISFASMDQTEYGQFVNRALDVIVSEIIPGINRDELVREVESMLGVRLADLIQSETDKG